MLPESAQTESSAPAPDEAAAEAPTAGEATADTSAATIGTPFIVDDVVYREILWDGLIPADYTAEAIMTKYGAQLAAIADGSPEAAELYAKMQEEFDSAPVNEVVDGTLIRLPGFIAPLPLVTAANNKPASE